ncbi:uncharacterized protein isoform X1 [Choristoneura fumiferana]|uniref:uncharacterized protein isoform X1 n=1 Tax=Choristoneura fumiferana TaxID=7141 RepID=UPI003D15B6CA
MSDIKLEIEMEELLACRICLATDDKLYRIYEHRLDEAFTDILGTNLSPCDGLPQRVCSPCRAQLQRSAGLRARARRTDAALRHALAEQHYLTNEFIRSIDRNAHSLTNDYSCKIFTDYPQTKIIEPERNDSCHSDNDHDADVKSDSDDLASRSCMVEIVENIAEVKILEERARKDAKKENKKKKPKERKKVIKVKGKPEVEWVVKKKPVRKRKGFKRYFMCDEDYIKFEEKYNIQVIRLSEEEQTREMEARKSTDSYLNALLRCEKCYKGFLSMFTYENHLKVHDPVSGANECALCQCRFKWPNNLRTHMIENHQLKYVCNQCQRVIKGRHEALLHAEFHAGKTWECKHCGRTFKKKSTFYTHVRMNHASEREETGGECGACGASFKGAPGLKLHQIKKCNKNMKPPESSAEAGTEPPTLCSRKGFICEVCGKKCTSLSILAVHLRAHTGDRPHACPGPGCPLRFAKKDNMEKHHRVVHLGQRPQVKCELCGKLLAHAASLKLHVRTVHLKLPAPPRPPRHRRKKGEHMEG